MTTLELKSNFHSLIDTINDDTILTRFYNIISTLKNSKEGMLWNRLSKEEQEELIQIEMNIHSSNVITNSEMQKKHSKWL